MIWAIVSKSGDVQIRHDDPKKDGTKAIRGKAVWQIVREPKAGERVSFDTGKIEFDASIIAPTLIAEIKAVAQQRVLEIAPFWKQLNDLANPDEQGAAQRRKQIDAIRAWSNDLESKVSTATSSTQIVAVRAALNEPIK